MSDFGPALNGPTVGSWFNAMLYMLEIVQLTTYIKHFWKSDKLPLRCVVITCFIVDTLCTIAICSWVFLSDVIHWGDGQYLTRQYWPVPTKVLCTSTVAALVQSFLISRYYQMSKQRIVSIILASLTLASFAGGVYVSVVLAFYSSYADRYKGLAANPVWMAASAVADTSIAIGLVISLVKAGSKTSMPGTKRLISRLIVVAIQSGTFTTILAILLLTTYLVKPTTNDSAYFSFCLGRAYTLTMLFNLNLRTTIKKARLRGASTANTVGIPGGSSGSKNRGSAGTKVSLGGNANRMELGRAGAKVDEEVYDLGGVQVHRTACLAGDEKRSSDNSGYGEPKVLQADLPHDNSHAI